MTEPDWKLLRQLSSVALDRFCNRVLEEVRTLTSQPGKTNHERYLAVYKRLQRRDRELANAFNDLRRSTAFAQLACMCQLKLITDEEFEEFSDRARGAVQLFLSG
jgi:hypothetical protein